MAKHITQKAKDTTNSIFVAGDYNETPTSPSEDMGIIGVIFGYITENIELCKDYGKSKPDSWVKTEEKIRINFKHDVNNVSIYYQRSLSKIKMIEEYFQTLDSEDQNDLHNYIFELYLKNKEMNISAMQNLHLLFDAVTPPKCRNNAQYKNISKAMVLFFFEDCTIFERTLDEGQLSIWE